MSADIAKQLVHAVRASEQRLVGLSHRIHGHPELAFEEVRASEWVADALAESGYETERGCFDLPTAVRATLGTGPVHVAICAEYDALPAIGHACGHNIIAAAAVGAAAALAPFVDDLGLRITVLGTPAEESGGGKVLMLERGAFAGLDAAMMVHPAPVETSRLAGLAVTQFKVEYQGKAAHAGASPELGLNAADAMTVAQVAVGLLRQQTTVTDRIQGIVSVAGSAPNIIPDESRGHWVVRSRDYDAVMALRDRVEQCFKGAAMATGCELTLQSVGNDYANLRSDPELEQLWCTAAAALGRNLRDASKDGVQGMATDMGNVSQVVPTIHPMLGLDCAPAMNHQPEFAAACVSMAANRAVLDGATAMAHTAVAFAASRLGS